MRRFLLATALFAAMLAPRAALADAAAGAHYSVADTDIGTLLDNPETRAVLDKWVPGMSSDPQIGMGRAMTLKAVQPYAPDKFPDALLARIDADLAKVPVKK